MNPKLNSRGQEKKKRKKLYIETCARLWRRIKWKGQKWGGLDEKNKLARASKTAGFVKRAILSCSGASRGGGKVLRGLGQKVAGSADSRGREVAQVRPGQGTLPIWLSVIWHRLSHSRPLFRAPSLSLSQPETQSLSRPLQTCTRIDGITHTCRLDINESKRRGEQVSCTCSATPQDQSLLCCLVLYSQFLSSRFFPIFWNDFCMTSWSWYANYFFFRSICENANYWIVENYRYLKNGWLWGVVNCENWIWLELWKFNEGWIRVVCCLKEKLFLKCAQLVWK